jgi:N-methylhydantoinase B
VGRPAGADRFARDGNSNLRKLAARYGAPTITRACAQILDSSERAMRAMIARMPDGHYEFEDFMGDDGLVDEPIRIHAAIEIRGEEMIVDLSGSGPQALGPIDATLASSGSAVSFAVMAGADEPIPANAGCYRPVTVIAPEGLIVSARHPAPVANRVAVTHRLATTLLGALHQAVPDRIPAAYYGTSYVCTFQTIGEVGERHVLVEIEVGGGGAHPEQDGPNAYACGMHNNSNIPIEMIESELPLTITNYELLPNTGGAGRRPGGLGLAREWRVDCPEAVFTTNLERFKFRPYGPCRRTARKRRPAFSHPRRRAACLGLDVGNLRLRRGDTIRLETSGGGGFGDPAQRLPEEVTRDMERGYVSTAGTPPRRPFANDRGTVTHSQHGGAAGWRHASRTGGTPMLHHSVIGLPQLVWFAGLVGFLSVGVLLLLHALMLIGRGMPRDASRLIGTRSAEEEVEDKIRDLEERAGRAPAG